MTLASRLAVLVLAVAAAVPAAAQTIESAYTELDLDKCRHAPGRDVEDYGSWRCAGHAGIAVHVAAGDQRMYVSFGPNAAKQPAAGQTFPGFNSVDKRRIEWRIERPPGGKPRPFAAILRWDVSSGEGGRGQVLVVTRLDGPVCHVGYVHASGNPEANALARRIADDHARGFNCGKDQPFAAGSQDLLPDGVRKLD